MATCNGAKYLQPQLDSILSQLDDDDELIISDDSSTDATVEIIQKMGDKRIRLLEGNTFYNSIYNFEYALQQASGELIFLADQDDIWLPDKVKTMTGALTDCDLAVSDCAMINASGSVVRPSFYAMRRPGPGFWKNFHKNSYLGCCMAFRAQVLHWALPFPENIPMHDIWLGQVAEMFGRTQFCPEVLVHYRRHGGNVAPEVDESPFSLMQKMRFRFNLIYRLLQRYMSMRKSP